MFSNFHSDGCEYYLLNFFTFEAFERHVAIRKLMCQKLTTFYRPLILCVLPFTQTSGCVTDHSLINNYVAETSTELILVSKILLVIKRCRTTAEP